MKTIIVKQGEMVILKNDDGEGILYTVTGSLIHPFEMIKTLSWEEVAEYEV